MQNIIYTGIYRQDTELGRLSRDYLYSLQTCDINLDTRPIYIFKEPIYTNENDDKLQTIPDSTTFCDNKHGYDRLIQFAPHFMSVYNGNFGKNFGIYTINNSNTKFTNIQHRASLLDGVLVGTKKEATAILPTQCKIIGIPINTELYNENIQPYDFKVISSTFKFYFIGSLKENNNISTLISAFLLEFRNSDKVSLTILTDDNKVVEMVSLIKKSLRKYIDTNLYKEVITMVGKISLKSKCGIHKAGDCFMASVNNNPYNQEILYAGLFKSDIIATNNLFDFVNKDNGWLVNSYNSPVIMPADKMTDTNTSNETWLEPDMTSLMTIMRSVYENEQKRKEKREKMHEQIINSNSYKQIGKNILCSIQ